MGRCFLDDDVLKNPGIRAAYFIEPRCYAHCDAPRWHVFAHVRCWELVDGFCRVAVHEHHQCRACGALFRATFDVDAFWLDLARSATRVWHSMRLRLLVEAA